MSQSRRAWLSLAPHPTPWRTLRQMVMAGFAGALMAFLKPEPSLGAYLRSSATGYAILQAAVTTVVLVGGLAIVERLYYRLRALAKSRNDA